MNYAEIIDNHLHEIGKIVAIGKIDKFVVISDFIHILEIEQERHRYSFMKGAVKVENN